MGMSTYMEWDQKVLEHIGDFADYISLHRYVDNHAGDTPNFLAVSNSIDRQIEEMDAACRFVQARRKSSKRAFLCFDEWNVWYKNMQMDGEGKFAPHLIEEVYNLEDALVVAGFLHSFVRHADTVKIANLAQIVNIIAPILTSGDHMLIQSIYYPFEMFSKRRSGISLNVMAVGDSYESKDHGVASYADTSAILDGGRLNVFITNRSVDEPLSIVIKPADLAIGSLVSGEILTASQPNSVNTYEEPNVVKTANFGEVNIKNGGLNCELPPLSFVALTLNVS
jgi:alpha-N-arabinofuranosidase